MPWTKGVQVEKNAVVLVPGLGLTPEAWSPTVARLTPAVRAVVTPLPGYGAPASRQDRRDLHPRALAETVVDQLQGVDGRLVLAGHSASCQVAAHAANLLGDRVAGVVLVGPTTDPAAASWPMLAQRWLRTAAHEKPWQVPSLVRQYSRTTLPAMLRAMDRARGDRIDLTLNRWDRPLLVLRGRWDRICSVEWGRHVARQSPEGTLHTLAAGGHMVPLTHGPLVARAVDDFLARTAVA